MPYTDTPGDTFRSDTETYVVTCTKNGAAFNLTGCTIWMTGKSSLAQNDSQAAFQLSTTAGTIVITNAAGGICEATIPAGTTSSLNSDTIILVDVQVKDAAGALKTVYTGKLVVYLDATQALT